MNTNIRVLGAGLIGNTLEIYDFALYGALAPLIAQEFFPSNNPTAALLSSLTLFAISFCMRPLGALLFGYIGDKWGHKQALILSIMGMALSTLTFVWIPPYTVIGIWASLILMLCRLTQSLCAGGEFSGAALYIMEHSPSYRRGLGGGLAIASSTLGALLAMFIGAAVLNSSHSQHWWRLPFLLGAGVGLVGLYLRRSLKESLGFKHFQVHHHTSLTPNPLKGILKDHFKSLLFAIGIAGFGAVTNYILAVYINIYLHTIVGLDLKTSMLYSSYGIMINLCTAIVSGYLSDHYGQRPVMQGIAILAVCAFYPLFLLLNSAYTLNIILSLTGLGIIAGGFNGPSIKLMSYLFPREYRYTGSSFGYGLGVTLFGGTLPLLSSYLIHLFKTSMAPVYYLIICAGMGLYALKKTSTLPQFDK